MFQVLFKNRYKGLTVPSGGQDVEVPLVNIGGIGPARGDTANLNVIETYSVDLIRGDRRTGAATAITNEAHGSAVFRKPVDRIGDKAIPNYPAYADQHIYDIRIPGCGLPGRMFVGQRRDGFVVNLAEAFDLINLNPLGATDAGPNVLADKNVTTLALEVPAACLTSRGGTIIGAWTTASEDKDANGEDSRDDHKRGNGHFRQVSRLGMPLVNELVIGIREKDKFNASEPKDDAAFGKSVTNPTLPVLINALFGVPAPASPRNDLVQVFLTGVPGLNRPNKVRPSEMLRLNVGIPPVDAAGQNPFGVLGGD